MLIQRATISDIDSIVKVTRTKENRKALPWVMKVALKDAIEHPKSDVLLVAKDENKGVLGFIRLHCRRDKKATIHEIAVLDNFKGKGIGTALLKKAEENVKEKDCKIIGLKTPSDLIGTHLFYIKKGFKNTSKILTEKRSLFVFEKEI